MVTNDLGSYTFDGTDWDFPYSAFEVRPTRIYKGWPGDPVVVSQPGGKNPWLNKEVLVQGVNLLEVGREYILFLKDAGPVQPGKYYITGAVEGKFEVAGEQGVNDKQTLSRDLISLEKELEQLE